ncbi:hypothetical protein KGO06_00040 [Patescibacteria group bacterium]|nr:hypothetical protein [Patescibacteria group bacterium]
MDLTDLIVLVTELIWITIPIAFAFALLGFFWGIVQLMGALDNADKRADARQMLLWSVIALFVIASLAGIIELLVSSVPGL